MINQSIPTPFSIEDEFRRLSHLPELFLEEEGSYKGMVTKKNKPQYFLMGEEKPSKPESTLIEKRLTKKSTNQKINYNFEKEFNLLNKNKEVTCASEAKRIEEQYKDQNLTAGSAVFYNGAFGMKSKLPGMKDSPRHAAVYLGHGLIAHFTGGAEPGQLQGKVQIDLFSTFEENAKKQGGSVIVENLETTRSSDEIIQATFNELGNTNYDALNNNCQHFVYRVITGKSKSPQVDELTTIVKKEVKKPVAMVTKKLTDMLVEKLPDTTVSKMIKPALKDHVGKALSSGIGSATGKAVELGLRQISKAISSQLANPNSWVSKTAGFFATALA